MKTATPTRLRALALSMLAAGLVIWLGWHVLPPSEPVWKGHRLSQWLDMFDSSLRFDASDGRHPPFTDQEIAEALDGIGSKALPFLRQWLLARPGRMAPRFNKWIAKLRWVPFRLAEDRVHYGSLAQTGFQYYAEEAQPLLPWLIQKSRSSDAHTRTLAYGAAFFTRPDREVFLPLAYAALNDSDQMVQQVAAQWMTERFPADAEKAGLRERFPQYFERWLDPISATNSNNQP